MLFPRMLALSEVAWSAKSARDYTDFSTRRLPLRLQELEKLNVFYRIPEAKVTFSRNAAGVSTAEITPFVANSQVYYTVDGHKADQTANLYNGPFALPAKGKSEKAMVLNYIIVTPGGRVSNMFTVPLEEK